MSTKETTTDPVPGDENGMLLEPANPHTAPIPVHMHIAEDDTDEQIAAKLRRQGVRLNKAGLAPAVFWPALIVVLAVAVFAIAWPSGASKLFDTTQNWIVTNLGWYYMLVIGVFVALVIAIGFSKLGRITLGNEGEKPEFGLLSWFSMLVAAGMGIGLVFYGVGEPLTYATVDPKPGWDGSQAEKSGLAMAQTFIHWGLHPWAVYAVIGLALAYAIHRRGRPVSIRWALEPILGSRVKGWIGDLVDVLAIFGTIFGVATSLGLGVNQISSGLKAIGLVDKADNTLLVVLIIVVTFIATMSVVSGVGAGMKWLSNINLSVAGLLMIAVLLLGPTLFLFQNFVQSLGIYLANFFNMTFDTGAFQGEDAHAWSSRWTIFYWGWWISWAPFVGIFIARISRGRTVRQFVLGVLLVPTLVGFLWFSVLGGAGLYRQFFGEGDLVKDGQVSAEGSLFTVLHGLPLGQIFSVVAIILVAIFFITSSDSGSLVVDMLASGGHPNPPTWSRILWSALEGALAIGLLLAGGLATLQAGSLATALPFSVILILMAIATIKGLRYESRVLEHNQLQRRADAMAVRVSDALMNNVEDLPELRRYVDDRIDYRITRSRGGLQRKPHHRPTGEKKDL